MDSTIKQRHPEDYSTIREGRSSLLEALDIDRKHNAEPYTHVEHNIKKAEKQNKRKELHTATYTFDCGTCIVNTPVLAQQLHLPEESDLGSVYIENPSNSVFSLIEGPSGTGRLISIVTLKSYRIISIADNISSVSLLPTTVSGTGIVIVTLFSHKWAPRVGAYV